MRRLGGKDLYAKQIKEEFIRIHFDPEIYADNHQKDTHTAFTYGLKRCVIGGRVTRRLQNTNSVKYRTLRKFVYSLV